MDLSIIIPAYNERDKICRDIEASLRFFNDHDFSGEVIVVDDGSVDDTAELVRQYTADQHGDIHLITYRPNRGKGHAVRQGMLKAKGNIVVFTDSGYCVPLEDLLPAIPLLSEGHVDLAYGSRFLRRSHVAVARPWHRRLISWLFRRFIRYYAGLPAHLTDSQCGFKAYTSEAAMALYGHCQTAGFLFDVEIILRAKKAGYRIVEFPVHWTPDPDSRLNMRQHLTGIVKEIKNLKRFSTTDTFPCSPFEGIHER